MTTMKLQMKLHMEVTDTDPTEYCEWCMIIPVEKGDKYCDACLQDMIDHLCKEYSEQELIEKGWY